MNKHYKTAKKSATNQLKQTKTQLNDIKNKFFNMNIPQHMEIILRNQIRFLSIVAGVTALIALFIMFKESAYIMAALSTGLIAMIIDFFIERQGISKRSWDYPATYLSFRKVPVEIPLLFFSCGILATFALYCFSTQPMVMIISNPVIVGLTYVQIALILIGIFFMSQYFTGKIKSMVFWILPFSIALYLSFSEPWVLVLSIFPMYIDYYLEKRLVKSTHIKYDKYGE